MVVDQPVGHVQPWNTSLFRYIAMIQGYQLWAVAMVPLVHGLGWKDDFSVHWNRHHPSNPPQSSQSWKPTFVMSQPHDFFPSLCPSEIPSHALVYVEKPMWI